MTTICWTVIHHAAAPIARGAAKIGQIARRIARPAAHHGAHAVHHGPTLATHPRVWFELVCKVVPAAVVGGGLLSPHPAGLPPRHEPPALMEPAPPRMLPGVLPELLPPGLPTGVSWGWIVPPDVPPPPYYAPPPYYGPPTDTAVIEYPPPPGVIEPSTGRLLLTALVGLLMARFAVRRGHAAGG